MKFLLGLDGKGRKMSASRPESAIFLNEDLDSVRKKIRGAYTGGNVFARFQENSGGVPEICPIYSLQAYHFLENDWLKASCSSGELLCNDCKGYALQNVEQYITEHIKQRNTITEDKIKEFLCTTPITSLFE